MNERCMQETLRSILEQLIDAIRAGQDLGDLDGLKDEAAELRAVRTFSEAGVLTGDKGLLITTADGAEFELTIVLADEEDDDERVDSEDACPDCGEDRADQLLWQESVEVECQSCGAIFLNPPRKEQP